MGYAYLDKLIEIENFGLSSIPVDELSYLIAVELMYSATINIPNSNRFNDVDYRDNDELKKALAHHINGIEERFVQSIERGEIQATFIYRDLDTGEILANQTLVNRAGLNKFLEIYGMDEIGFDRDYPIGNRFEFEDDLLMTVIELIARERSLYSSKFERELFERTKKSVIQAPELLDAIIEENAALHLKVQMVESLTRNAERPLIKRERETLSIIIAVLAKESRIDISKVSKAGELIANLTQEVGAPIGATTIENHLKNIPQALESRIK